MLPLSFEPFFRPQVWGGRWLADHLGKPLPAEGRFGESWEVSAHPLHVSRVVDGPWRGTTLTELWRDHAAELLGRPVQSGEKFPLLVKLLDCQELLSVQVHPDDPTARSLLGDDFGKTEAWVVLDAAPTARVYAGLRSGIGPDELRRHLAAGTVADCLHQFVPRAGDCLLLRAGTVHAVGGGVRIAEVQQSSDATFRLFDWNRPGPDGQPRTLHIEQSLASIDWTAGPLHPLSPLPLPELPSGVHGERLARCPYFELRRYHLTAPLPWPPEGSAHRHRSAGSLLPQSPVRAAIRKTSAGSPAHPQSLGDAERRMSIWQL